MLEQPLNRALPAPENAPALPAFPERIAVYPSNARPADPNEEEHVPLAHYLWILKRHRWQILAFVVVAVASTVIVSSRLTPIYEATATIDIDRQAPAGVIGQDATRLVMNDGEQFLTTQVRLIQSDSVLRPVAQRFKIPAADMEMQSTKLPMARAADAPVVLKRLRVTRPPNTFLLLITYRSPDPYYAAGIANGIAQSYIQHTYNIRFRSASDLSSFMEKQLEELKAKMERSSEALVRFEKELDVINPEERTSILSSRLLQLNTELTNAQADRVRKEAAYDSVKGGTLAAAQASTQGEQLRNLSDRIAEVKERFASITAQYGPTHPEYKKAASQLAELQRQLDALQANIATRVGLEYQEAVQRESMLRKAVGQTKDEFDRLNSRSFEYKALKQEAGTDKGLYEELVRKIKEAGINSSFQNSGIRLADLARPGLKPVFPNVPLNAALALLGSCVLAFGVAFAVDTLDHTLRDPEQIQRGLGTEVLGSLPVVRSWHGRLLAVSRNGHSGGALVAANGNGTGRHTRASGQSAAFEEAVRTLRDSILLSDLGRRPRSLLLTSATPREGKTTTIVHLAVAHSLQKRKTLLIDADLRRPGIHTRLGLSNERGLRNVITDGATWRELLQTPEGFPDLAVLVAGPASQRAADRLGGTLEGLLAEAENDYDLVLVDSPPLLGFAEPLQMAALVDGVVVITLAGQTNRTAVATVLNSLRRLKANVIGVALNEVHADLSDRYYYYGYHGKYYSKYYKPTAG